MECRWGSVRSGVALAGLVLALGCSGDQSGLSLLVGAQYDPTAVSNLSTGIEETNTSVAQIFTVIADGKLEQFQLALTNAESDDDGTVRITIRPLDAGLPNADAGTSIIRPIDLDVSTLPNHPIETFTVFDVGDDPGRQVTAGQQYAIVVEFVSRAVTGAASDGLPIARILGREDDGYADGTASTSADGTTWMNVATDDYFFRIFSLRDATDLVDAQYDPADVSNTSAPISETTTSAAQIYTVLSDGKLQEFELVLTDAESVDGGTVRVTVRPLDGGGLPDPAESSSIITPIDVDVTTLPADPMETFSVFDVRADPGRDVLEGEEYALVVEFVSRAVTGAASDGLPIARLRGRDDDGYLDGAGSTSPDGVLWTNSAMDDYFFRTTLLR